MPILKSFFPIRKTQAGWTFTGDNPPSRVMILAAISEELPDDLEEEGVYVIKVTVTKDSTRIEYVE